MFSDPPEQAPEAAITSVTPNLPGPAHWTQYSTSELPAVDPSVLSVAEVIVRLERSNLSSRGSASPPTWGESSSAPLSPEWDLIYLH